MFRKFEVLPKLARSIQLRGPPALWAEQRAAIFAEGEAAPRYRHRMSRTARGTAALLSPQGSLSASSQRSRALHRSSVVPIRFGDVGVCAEIPLFCWSARPTIGIHGNSHAVVFRESATMVFLTLRGDTALKSLKQTSRIGGRLTEDSHGRLTRS